MPGRSSRTWAWAIPWLDIYTVVMSSKGDTPPKDPFTGREVYSHLDPDRTKVLKLLEWMYNKWAPTMLTRYGAAGDTLRIGEKDRYGRSTTAAEALGKWFDVNVVAPTTAQARKEPKAVEKELRLSLAWTTKDSTVPADEKSVAKAALTEQLRELRQGNPEWFVESILERAMEEEGEEEEAA